MPPARPVLSADQIEAYHRNGFIVPPYRLPATRRGLPKATP